MTVRLLAWLLLPFAFPLVAPVVVAGLNLGGSKAPTDSNRVDLAGMVITDAQASSNGVVFGQRSEYQMGVKRVLAPRDPLDEIAARKVRQIVDVLWVSNDARFALRVRLVETTSAHWAEGFHGNKGIPRQSNVPGIRAVADLDNLRRFVLRFVKSRIVVVVDIDVPEGSDIDHNLVNDLLIHAAEEQYSVLPILDDIDHSTKLFPGIREWLIGLNIAAVPGIALLLGFSATFRDVGTLERLRRTINRPQNVTFRDITAATNVGRRRGMRRVFWQFVIAMIAGVTAALLPMWVSMGPIRQMAILPIMLAVVMALYAYLIPYSSSGSVQHRSYGRYPVLIGTVGAAGVLYVCVFCFTAAIAVGVLLKAGFLTIVMAGIFVLLGLNSLKKISLPLQAARSRVQPDVEESLADDPRQEILLLRSFQDDELLMRMHRGSRHSPAELAAVQPFDRFEELLAWTLWRFGPVCALGQPPEEGEPLQPLGAAREYYSDDTWEAGVRDRMRRSSILVFVAGRSPSLYREYVNVQRLDVIGKCAFVFPPVDYVELRLRLGVLESALGFPAGSFTATDSEGRRLLGIYFDDDGAPILVGVDGRDDFAYQAFFAEVGEKLVSRTRRVRLGTTSGPVEPTPEVEQKLVRFDPTVSYSYVFTLWEGVLFTGMQLFRPRSASSGGSSGV